MTLAIAPVQDGALRVHGIWHTIQHASASTSQSMLAVPQTNWTVDGQVALQWLALQLPSVTQAASQALSEGATALDSTVPYPKTYQTTNLTRPYPKTHQPRQKRSTCGGANFRLLLVRLNALSKKSVKGSIEHLEWGAKQWLWGTRTLLPSTATPSEASIGSRVIGLHTI